MDKTTILCITVLLVFAPAAVQSQTQHPPRRCSIEDGRGKPQYPEELKGSGIQGTVLIQAVTGEDGCAKNITVVKKVHPRLDGLARQAVNSWKFSPAKKDGKPVMVLVQIPVEFKDPGR